MTLQAAHRRQVGTRLHPEPQLPCGAGLQVFCKFKTYAVHSETVHGCVFSLGLGASPRPEAFQSKMKGRE